MDAKPTVPVQLHLLILSFYTTDSSHDVLNYVIIDKHSLGTISLVCRRWADEIRPEIFAELTLRNYEDADALLGFVRNPHSQISDYIRQLICTNKLWCTVTAKRPRRNGNLAHSSSASERQAVRHTSAQPWIHIVCNMGETHLSSLRSIQSTLPDHSLVLNPFTSYTLSIPSMSKSITQASHLSHSTTYTSAPSAMSYDSSGIFLYEVWSARTSPGKTTSSPKRQAYYGSSLRLATPATQQTTR